MRKYFQILPYFQTATAQLVNAVMSKSKVISEVMSKSVFAQVTQSQV